MNHELNLIEYLLQHFGSHHQSYYRLPPVSTHTQSLKEGDIFLAIQGGHGFVRQALDQEAKAVIVNQDWYQNPTHGLNTQDPRIIPVDSTITALQEIATYHRFWHQDHVRTIGITGSCGKTTVKEMIGQSLASWKPTIYAKDSYNNHLGVPLTIMGIEAHTQFLVCEIGMNHPGEIAPLSHMVKPDIAIITTIEPAHMEFFSSLESIAVEKASIMDGMKQGEASVILPSCSPFYPLLRQKAQSIGASIMSVGSNTTDTVQLINMTEGEEQTMVEAVIFDHHAAYALSLHGKHQVMNSLMSIAAMVLCGMGWVEAIERIKKFRPVTGRGDQFFVFHPAQEGKILCINEAYNANPSSMKQAITTFDAMVLGGSWKRKIAIVGEMLELGDGKQSQTFHDEVAHHLAQSQIDVVVAIGPMMVQSVQHILPSNKTTYFFDSVASMKNDIWRIIQSHDCFMAKASHGTGLFHWVRNIQVF
jgi:UDP-N-acetylmuramoyl-tripeptide--D-alanyl-D-alanine ligase